MLGKLIHKPDQVTVENQDGDILYSSVARSVGGNVEGACRTIQNASRTAKSYRSPQTTAFIAGPIVVSSPQAAVAVPLRERVVGTSKAATSIPALGLMGTTRDEGGVRIVALASGGTAEQAYMHVGDVINMVDGKRVNTIMELASAFGSIERGAKVRVGYMFPTAALGLMQKELILTAQ